MSDGSKKSSDYQVTGDVANNLEALGLTVPVWDRPITREEVQYFLDRWPFLQMVSGNQVESFEDVKIVTAQKSNWKILSYGDAMASSPGEFLFGGGDFTINPDLEDGGDIVNPDKGTVWRQAYFTVQEMVQLAQTLDWESIHVVDGHPLMKWAAWTHSLDQQLGFSGFEPSEKDHARRERVKRSDIEYEKLLISQPRI